MSYFPYIATSQSRANIRANVLRIRKALGYEKEFYFPIVEFLEIQYVKYDPDFNLIVVEDDELESGVQALAIPEEHTIKVKQSVYNGAVDGTGVHRLSLAHEFGHLIMHCEQSPIILQRNTSHRKLRAFEDPDWQAEVFGAELLVPHNLIGGVPADVIAKMCGVSLKCANCQIKNYNK